MSTTYLTKEEAALQRKWFLIDAKDLILGRMCVEIADLIRGKRKPVFSPHYDCGDFVVVINSEKVRLSGNKLDGEFWYRHSGYPGGLKMRSGREMVEKFSDKLIFNAVRRMLPKNKSLSKSLLKKLKIYSGGEHPHLAQQLVKHEINA